jgi:hypothetical protein
MEWSSLFFVRDGGGLRRYPKEYKDKKIKLRDVIRDLVREKIDVIEDLYLTDRGEYKRSDGDAIRVAPAPVCNVE